MVVSECPGCLRDTNGARRTVFCVPACLLLALTVVTGGQQGELSGIRGQPVDGHDVIASIEIVGTNHVSGFQNMRERFRSNGAELRLGLPLESQTLCRFKEVLRDILREKGYPDAEITHDMKPTHGDRTQLALVFTVTQGKRSRRSATAPVPTPAERCSR
jgi:hypothetical protein